MDLTNITEPVAHTAMDVATGNATRLDLFRAMWRCDEFTDDHYVTVNKWLDQQAGRQIKGNYHGHWNFLVKLTQALYEAETTGEQPPHFAIREHRALAVETGQAWSWRPAVGQIFTVRALLGVD